MNIRIKNPFAPISLPVIFFMSTIAAGAILLHSSFTYSGAPGISWLDALFTATSAVCVTGLTVVDTGTAFTPAGQAIILLLIQVGGLGIMSFSSLAFYLWKRRVSLTDRIAVGQSLLYDSRFHLGRFLIQIVLVTVFIELTGALVLFALDSQNFSPFSALFHSISAFCNAGFSLYADSLMRYEGNLSVNLTIMALIVLGGLGFAVIVEGKSLLWALARRGGQRLKPSWHFTIVIRTSLFLIVIGWLYIYFSEFINYKEYLPFHEAAMGSLFQSVTCRTAGFNTLNISGMTNVSLFFMMFLMFVGGAPGSCAGGIKVTTFRVLFAFIVAQIRGRQQATIGNYAVDRDSINKSLTLLFFSLVIIFACIIALDFSEGGDIPHTQLRGQFLEISFEAVSAFGTVGLSTGLTPDLSPVGKTIIIFLMFVGRLGPLVLLNSMQSFGTKLLYSLPEEKLSIG
jgi:trk system potassium uptake protein TrkH